MKVPELSKGFIRKRENRALGIFIDGTGLDRATRRLNKKVDMTALLRGVSSGRSPVVARYYTIIPHEDDSRHRAYLDAVASAGMAVIVKRLPPKGITRQVSIDLEMASDIVAFAMGHTEFNKENEYLPANPDDPTAPRPERVEKLVTEESERIKTSVVVVCPSRELTYPLSLLRELDTDTTSADFGQFKTGDILKAAMKWIDLSNSETIWRE